MREAVSPLLWPVAWMLWLPGRAVGGMVMPKEKLPILLVVVVPTVVVVSKMAMTVSLLPKPVPLTVTVVVGGPVTFESVMGALAGVARTARRVMPGSVRLNARTTSRAGPMVIRREIRACIH